MLGVCFFVHEPRTADWDRPKIQDWHHVCRAFEVDKKMYVDPFEPANLHWPNIVHHKTLESAMASTGDVPWVFLEYNEPSSIALPDFEHPEDVVYCFGSDRRGLDEIDRSLGQWVNIPTYDSLYANQAAAIVLAHRKFIS